MTRLKRPIIVVIIWRSALQAAALGIGVGDTGV